VVRILFGQFSTGIIVGVAGRLALCIGQRLQLASREVSEGGCAIVAILLRLLTAPSIEDVNRACSLAVNCSDAIASLEVSPKVPGTFPGTFPVFRRLVGF